MRGKFMDAFIALESTGQVSTKAACDLLSDAPESLDEYHAKAYLALWTEGLISSI